MLLSHIMFPIFEVKRAEIESAERGVCKGQVQCGKGVSGRRRDLSRAERLLQWFLTLRNQACFSVGFIGTRKLKMVMNLCASLHKIERFTQKLTPIAPLRIAM